MIELFNDLAAAPWQWQDEPTKVLRQSAFWMYNMSVPLLGGDLRKHQDTVNDSTFCSTWDCCNINVLELVELTWKTIVWALLLRLYII